MALARCGVHSLPKTIPAARPHLLRFKKGLDEQYVLFGFGLLSVAGETVGSGWN
jgi:hypothetical protein